MVCNRVLSGAFAHSTRIALCDRGLRPSSTLAGLRAIQVCLRACSVRPSSLRWCLPRLFSGSAPGSIAGQG
jgi:hypothetical protein